MKELYLTGTRLQRRTKLAEWMLAADPATIRHYLRCNFRRKWPEDHAKLRKWARRARCPMWQLLKDMALWDLERLRKGEPQG